MGKKSRARRERMMSKVIARENETLLNKAMFYDRLFRACDYAAWEFDQLNYELEVKPRHGDHPAIQAKLRHLADFAKFHVLLHGAVVVNANAAYEVHDRGDGFQNVRQWLYAPIRPPFHSTFIDFGECTLVDDSGASFGCLGVLVDCSSEDNPNWDLSDVVDPHPMLAVTTFFAHVDEDEDFSSEDVWTWDCSLHLDEDGFCDSDLKEYRTGGANQWARFINSLCSTIKILQLMNVKNIQFVDNEPDTRASELHKREFGIPMTKYKTLQIKPIRKQYENPTNPKDYQGLMPLHLRRGSFATYTDDAPLFGKYTGTFWRPATVVGEEERGVVIKDYKVDGDV